MTTKMPARDLDVVIRYLETGLHLSLWETAGERRFYAGHITRERNTRGSVRTTHLTADLGGYVWLTKAGIGQLAAQARKEWDRIDAMVAGQQAAVQRAYGRA